VAPSGEFGLVFPMPLLEAATAGAVGGKLAGVGIDDEFIAEVKQKVTSGTSALEVPSRVLYAPDESGARAGWGLWRSACAR
jgi:uncharacterized membrane protein